MAEHLGIDAAAGLEVVLATVGIVVALVVLVRVSGQRSLATMSTVDVACVVALGAVVGRTTLLEAPTSATGVIALVVLFVLRMLLSRVQHSRLHSLMAPQPVVLMADGQVCAAAMRRARVSEDDLRQRLRLAGVAARSQVRLAVLERTGQISVIAESVGECEYWLRSDVDGGRPAV